MIIFFHLDKWKSILQIKKNSQHPAMNHHYTQKDIERWNFKSVVRYMFISQSKIEYESFYYPVSVSYEKEETWSNHKLPNSPPTSLHIQIKDYFYDLLILYGILSTVLWRSNWMLGTLLKKSICLLFLWKPRLNFDNHNNYP